MFWYFEIFTYHFLKACRGAAFDKGVSTMVTDAGEDLIVHKLPIEADILVAYSTVPGMSP